MKIKFIKEPTGAGYSYFTGDAADIPESAAKELIADGYAEEVKEEGGGEILRKAKSFFSKSKAKG